VNGNHLLSSPAFVPPPNFFTRLCQPVLPRSSSSEGLRFWGEEQEGGPGRFPLVPSFFQTPPQPIRVLVLGNLPHPESLLLPIATFPVRGLAISSEPNLATVALSFPRIKTVPQLQLSGSTTCSFPPRNRSRLLIIKSALCPTRTWRSVQFCHGVRQQ